MDSSGGSEVSYSAADATQLLKNMLQLGQPSISTSHTSTSQSGGSSVSHLPDDNNRNSSSAESFQNGKGNFMENSNNSNMMEMLHNITQNQSITQQKIILTGEDTKNSFSIYGRDVEVYASKNSRAAMASSGSNKVKISPVVNFDWEHKHYIGNLVAVHRNGIHVAYVLRGKSGGVVRLINRKTAERALLKGYSGSVLDVTFAHLSAVVLGTVDEIGNMFIYEILEDKDGKIDAMLLLHVCRPESTLPSDNHRLIWCPYIPEDEDSSGTTATTVDSYADNAGKLLVLTHDNVAEMWNVDMVTKEYGNGPMLCTDVEIGCIIINSHIKPITDAAFSPDGTALATASLDGDVKFFQVYMHEKSPKCLHQWQPHDGKPVSSLFFLDDHKHPNPEIQFWKFAVTGGNNNRNIKIWSCESWTCLQTLNFCPTPDMPNNFSQEEPCLKAAIDLSANYLCLSDIKRKVLYILQVYQDATVRAAHVASLSEFLLAQPCLSFAILDASRWRFKKSPDTSENLLGDITTGEVDGQEDEEVSSQVHGTDIGTLVKMYSMHTKALQELQIRFQAESSVTHPPPAASVSTLSQEDHFKDRLSDFSHDTIHSELDMPTSDKADADKSVASEASSKSEDMSMKPELKHLAQAELTPRSMSSSGTPPQPILLGPDAFTSLSPRKGELPGKESLVDTESLNSTRSSLTQVTGMDEDALRSARGSILQGGDSFQSSLLKGDSTLQESLLQAEQSHPSPGSSITLTPASSKDSPFGLKNITPGSLPLPPPTPGEDDVLKQPPHMAKAHGECPGTPPSAKMPPLSAGSLDFMTSSPGTKLKDFKPPSTSQDSAEVAKSMDDIFSEGGTIKRRTALRSTGSSSSTSLEVSEILEGAKKPGQDDQYVEEDEPQDDEEEEEEEMEEDAASSDVKVKDVKAEKTNYDSTIWPSVHKLPVRGLMPEKDVTDEAQRLADAAIKSAAAFHLQVGPSDSAEVPEEELEQTQDEDDDNENEARLHTHDGEDSGEGEEDQQQEEDVVIEEDEEDNVNPKRTVRNSGDHMRFLRAEPVDLRPIHELQTSVQQMMSLLQNQQKEIEQLRSELAASHQQQALPAVVPTGGTSMEQLQARLDGLEGSLTSHVTGALSKHSLSESQRLSQMLHQRESQEKQKHDRLVSAVSQTLEKTLSGKLDKMIKDEIRNSVVPTVKGTLEPLKASLHTDLSQKLSTTDHLLKDNIGKMVRSKNTIEAIGNAAGSAIQGPLHAACRDVLIPSFNSSTQAMFQQVNTAFQRGTQEYSQQLSGHLDQVRRRHDEGRDAVVMELRAMVNAFQRAKQDHDSATAAQLATLHEALQAHVASADGRQDTLEHNINLAITTMEESIVSRLKNHITDEVQNALKDQQTSLSTQLIEAMRSTAATPAAVTPDPQMQQANVLQLLRQGQLNTAFQQALSASDLSLVMFVCETVNPSQVFNQQPCPLQQPVLLSLIQQLSAELGHQTELKHKYLEEALMNLDQSNPITKEHMTAVLGQLCQNLMGYVQQHPQDKMSRQLRMLQMASQSLLK